MAHNDPQCKPLTRAQQQRRSDIVRAALKVFDRDGFEGARIEDVAREAEIAKGTVYLYFPNKQALLEGVVHEVISPEVDEVERTALDPQLSPGERLRRQIKIIGARLGSGDMKIILRLMMGEGPKNEELRKFYYHEVVERGMAAISQCLADGVRTGEFVKSADKIEPQVFAGTPLLAAVWGILFDDLAPLDVNKLLESHCEQLLTGLERR
ncbi:MAG: TetR/AcrR family transcriptional regulator [Gammaproteobacteria bacterium]